MSFRALALWLVLLGSLTIGGRARASGPGATVAVLYFDYDGSDEEMGFLRKGLAQMLVTDLTGVAGVEIVERARLEEILKELDLGQTRKFDSRTAVRVGKLLGAHRLILGGYFDMKGSLRIDARVLDVKTSKVLYAVGANRKVDDFLMLESELAGKLRSYLASAAPAPAPTGTKPTKTTKTTKPTSTKPRAIKTAGATKPGAIKPGGTKTMPISSGGVGAGDAPAAKAAPPVKVHARQVARYGQALDSIDQGNEERARALLRALVKDAPGFQAPALDLKLLAK